MFSAVPFHTLIVLIATADYDRLHFCDSETQRAGFKSQIKLAAEVELPMCTLLSFPSPLYICVLFQLTWAAMAPVLLFIRGLCDAPRTAGFCTFGRLRKTLSAFAMRCVPVDDLACGGYINNHICEI
jgi:hypothetical protein